mmetsp:Transcript_31333/g.38812  ORF Transcript_31333/g.38812 Transcript_31333/m.38812 type:complete len:179 (+) Transcript_31333:781-1317(+)|eukprot:CAMPEP_0170458384 /NCGR_PEP_ID=MMETSP0123-20130129/5365_1 /TAXON_ID=182087 /ORGANISM="Favella ehrenbergii, Strain Fehren 1" /LENGTH=178 /DNA_ID=CAMNT_0010722501 /DNA_START=416 /DNA_END=952 /DNA_ORIENTATION=-
MATPFERQSFTELKMIDEFRTRHKFSILFNKSASKPIVDDELPSTRALVGPVRTNLDFGETSEASKPIFDFNNSDGKHGALHATVEHCEKNSGLRFARTLFLTTLARDENYLDGVWLGQDPDNQAASEQGLLNQANAQTLFNCYQALISAFDTATEQYLQGQISQNDLLGFASFQAYN